MAGKDDPKKPQGPQATVYPAFMPGQLNALSQQLAQGFGGNGGKKDNPVQDWRQQLNGIYSPTHIQPFYYGPDPAHTGGGGGKDPGKPGGDGGGGNPPTSPWNDHSAQMAGNPQMLPPQMGMMAQRNPMMGMQQNPNPMPSPGLPQLPSQPMAPQMQAQMPPQMQQQQPGAQQGQPSLSPQMLALLRQRMMFGR